MIAAGIDGSYSVRQVDEPGMVQAIAEIRSGELDGANVTMPHKHLAATLVDELSADARRCQAVNTVVRSDRGLVGHLTDIEGVRGAIDECGLPRSGPVLVLGAGGAAAAAILAVEGRPLRVAARRPGVASAVLQRLGAVGVAAEWGTPWASATVINATPIGMVEDGLPEAVLQGASGLVDMTYRDGPTEAVVEARRRGIPAADGLDMLLAQGAASFSLWTGVPAPLSAMRSALSSHRKS